MVRLKITDNNRTEISRCVLNEPPLTNNEIDSVNLDIERIANIKIANLQFDDNPNLLFFPQVLGYHGDNISESVIIGLHDNRITTGNIMGFIGVNNTQIDIRSRFAKEDGNDYFLHYMLQKVFAINLFDIKHTTDQEQVFDFLLYLFPYFLQKALGQGLYKKYRRFEYNDANIRGPIDVSRHIRQNIPFRGTVAYSTREHSYDNEVTQLIRHTIEYIKTKANGVHILNNSKETKDAVSQIVMATQTYNVRERQKVINQNLRPVRHPYYSSYTELQKICLQILRHESLKYGQEKDKVYGILFDGAWLWEEYLGTILEKCGFTHSENLTGKNPITLYKGNLRYPDFYKTEQIKKFKYGDSIPDQNDILDAKYKPLDSKSDRDDIHQIITYMHILPSKRSGLLYPCEIPTTPKEYEVYGIGGKIRVIGLNVSHACDDFSRYVEVMNKEELDLISKIK